MVCRRNCVRLQRGRDMSSHGLGRLISVAPASLRDGEQGRVELGYTAAIRLAGRLDVEAKRRC